MHAWFYMHLLSSDICSHSELLNESDEAASKVLLPETDHEEISFKEEHSFLLVLQTTQQSKWLQQYGNMITCMDATYKICDMDSPAFLL